MALKHFLYIYIWVSHPCSVSHVVLCCSVARKFEMQQQQQTDSVQLSMEWEDGPPAPVSPSLHHGKGLLLPECLHLVFISLVFPRAPQLDGSIRSRGYFKEGGIFQACRRIQRERLTCCFSLVLEGRFEEWEENCE